MTSLRPFRILYLVLDGFPTFRPDLTALWGKYLADEGIASDLVTVENPNEAKTAEWGGGHVFVCPRPASRIAEQFRSFFHDLRILITMKRGTYDAIQVRDKSFICVPALLVARFQGIPFFYWMSFPMAESLARLAKSVDRRRQFARWAFLWFRGHIGAFVLYRLILPRADHIFVQSDKMADDLETRRLDRRRMTAVPMCFDPERYPEPLPHEKPPELVGRPVVGYLGECSRIRRIDFLFEAIAKVREKIPNVFLLIIGDAIESADQVWLRRCISELGLDDHVRMTGWVKSDEVSSLFACVDVALTIMAPDPILDSTTPTKLVEYLAMGRPVVANDHPDHRYVLEGSGAGIVTPFNVQDYSDAITNLLNDPGRRAEMGDMGRAWALSNRSYPDMGKRLAMKYRVILDKDVPEER